MKLREEYEVHLPPEDKKTPFQREREKNPLLHLEFLLGIHILHFRATDRITAFNKPGLC